ncbi:hypothetical protein STEG23_022770, partial [Scotinomys teguina]
YDFYPPRQKAVGICIVSPPFSPPVPPTLPLYLFPSTAQKGSAGSIVAEIKLSIMAVEPPDSDHLTHKSQKKKKKENEEEEKKEEEGWMEGGKDVNDEVSWYQGAYQCLVECSWIGFGKFECTT